MKRVGNVFKALPVAQPSPKGTGAKKHGTITFNLGKANNCPVRGLKYTQNRDERIEKIYLRVGLRKWERKA